MKTLRRFLIVRADGTCRVTTRRPSLRQDEVAYRLNVNVPDAWGKVKGDIDITLPEPPPALVDEQVE